MIPIAHTKDWYPIITKENYQEVLENNLRERAKLVSKASDNADIQNLIIKKCENCPIYFFSYWLYTSKNSKFFERDMPQNIPFIPFEFQIDFILDVVDAIFKWKVVFIEKSRQMWLTRLLVGIFFYMWRFHWIASVVVSKTQSEVDIRWDMDSSFEKLRFMARMLPQWMLPLDFSKEAWTEYNKSMIISKKDWNESITGKAAGPDAWRWGTKDVWLMDEMAFMQYASAINKAMWSNCRTLIYNSTPNGEWNEYYRMRKLALKEIEMVEKWELKEEEMVFSFHRLHWSEHPFYDQEWYDKKTRSKTPEEIAQELDINYNVAIKGRVYPEFKSPTVQFDCLDDYDTHLPLYVVIDNGHGWADPHAIIVAQPELNSTYLRIIDYMEDDCTIDQIASLLAKNPEQGYIMDELVSDFYDRYVNYKKAVFVSDPYDTNSTWNDTSILKIYRKNWIHLQIPEPAKWIHGNIVEQIRLTRTNLHRLKIHERCTQFVSVIQNARYPQSREWSEWTSVKNKPVHDWTSHGRTALEYLMLFILKLWTKEENKKKRKERKKVRVEVGNPITWGTEYIYI